jgi:hypothetical protein
MANAIHGVAYGRSASLEVIGDTLRWRAHRGFKPIAENIVTTVHDVRLARWIVQRFSWAGVLCAALGAVWLVRESLVLGAGALAAGTALVGWRLASPRRVLILELAGPTQLVLDVGAPSAAAARALAARIDRAIASGEGPSSPPMLP